MPLDPVNDRRPPITPQMALRVAGVGVLGFVLFGIIFFRLWYLQVLDGDKYLAQARENRVRTERIQAPRGAIVDANNLTLVDNRRATVVSLDPRTVPVALRTAIAAWGQQMTARSKRPKGHQGPRPPMPQATGDLAALYHRLARVLQLSPQTISRRVVQSIVQVPYANVRLKTDVPRPQRDYIAERRAQFPGVTVDQAYVRAYPNRSLAAQLLGTVGEITQSQLDDRKSYKGIKAGTDIGQNGLEAEYDQYLRGEDGSYRIEVNAAGERRRALTATDPKPGRTLKLTLDQGLQQAGEAAIRKVAGGLPGAFVALNPETGAIYAMGSQPSYDPRQLNGPFATKAAYDAKFGQAAGAPLINRADESAYPTGSIFKPITALAAMSAGVMRPTDTFNDTGCYQTGARTIDRSCNAKRTANGTVSLVSALKVSSDVYFYDLGKKLYNQGSTALQTWSRKMGLGRKTGIDVPYERAGLIPSPAWVRTVNAAEMACRKKTHKPSCGIGSGAASWNPGDNENLAVGQGALQATPLQMAVVYSTLVNGGRVPRPHLAAQVQDSNGFVQKIDAPTARQVTIDPAWRAPIMQGLYDAANADKGTSKQVWDNGWPRSRFPIFGKTGTAERFYGPSQIEKDQSWYVAYSYDTQRQHDPIVVVCTIEQAGFGAEFAAPAARLIMSKYFGVQPKVVRGSSQTR
jgi:penicillin-binding protein 2